MRRTSLVAILAISFAGGCAAVLGFEDTSVRAPGDDAAAGDGAKPGDDAAAGGDAASSPSLTLAPPKVIVLRGGSSKATATLARNGLSGPVTVKATGLPAGVAMPDGSIPAGADSAELTFTATAAAAMGPASNVKIGAAGVPEVALDLTVAGPPGALDESFDGDGILSDNVAGNAGVVNAIAIQPDGKILAGGTGAGGNWLIRRYNADGSADATFNTKAQPAQQTGGEVRAIVIDPVTQKIVVAGPALAGTTTQATVVRLNADGSADSAFANSGLTRLDTVGFANGSTVEGAVVEADSNIVIAGSKTLVAPSSYSGFILRLDKKTGAYTSLFTGADKTRLVGVSLEPGKIAAAGEDGTAAPPGSQIVRVLAAGGPDTTISATGAFTFLPTCSALGYARRPDGVYVVTGKDITGPNFCSGAAMAANGKFLWDFRRGMGNSAQYTAAATMADNRTVIVGYGGGSQDRFALVARAGVDGKADPAWNGGNAIEFADPATPDTYVYQWKSVTLDALGRIVVGGNKNNAGFTLIRMWP
jgi:uncharacterized delta-60 repeat protein